MSSLEIPATKEIAVRIDEKWLIYQEVCIILTSNT